MSRIVTCLGLVLILAGTAFAQFPYQQQPYPPAPGPLMYVRFLGPAGAKITVYRGIDGGQTLELPCTLGFRPGYSYRFSLYDLPGWPRQVFSPTLEVRGTLALAPTRRNADFPAHVVFNEEEILRISRGAYVKKVIALERPDQAFPIATKPDQPLEFPVPATRDPYAEAADRGQPLLVYHMGQRFLTPEELNRLAVPGTVLLPGEKVLGLPKLPPYLFWNWYPVFDPILGPRPAAEFVNIYDGGDIGARAGFNRFGKLKGLDATDTIAEYLDSKGNQRLAISNRVALAVPRFVIFKGEYNLAASSSRLNVDSKSAAAMPAASVGQAKLQGQSQASTTDSVGGKVRLAGAFNTLGTSVAGRIQGLNVKSNLRSVQSVDAIASKGTELTDAKDAPLMIIKWPDKTFVNVGDIVTFYLKYSNTGGLPITNVVVSDSLAARFEYVDGSAKTDRDALFTMQTNEAGSKVLRWEFTGSLPARENGIISFQVRVR